jgi:hypothetical protein
MQNGCQIIQKPEDLYGFQMLWQPFCIKKPDSKSVRKMNIGNPDGPDFGC